MIPRLFHSVWVGPPMPEHLAEYVATWTRVHTGWHHKVWGESDLDWLQNQELFDFAEAVTRHHGQFRADIARYEVLHRYGGVYVDCDFEALCPIDDLLMGVDCFAAWETDDVWINNAIMGCVPGHPLLIELIDGLPANVKRHRGKRPNVTSGPQYLTPLMRDRDDVTLFRSAQFYPFRWDQLERRGEHFPEAYAVHHWERKTALAR